MDLAGMIMKKFVVFSLLLLVMYSCGSSEKKEAPEVKRYELKSKYYKELIIRYPLLSVMGDYLIVSSSMERDTLCHFYAIDRNMEEVASYGRLGQGPGEFIQPVLTYTDGDEFAMNDLNHNVLAIIGVTEKDGGLDIRERIRLKGEYKPKKGELVPRDIMYTKIGDSHFVSKLEAGEGRFFNLLDSALVPIYSFGESPIKEEIDSYVSGNRLQGEMHVYKNKVFFGTSDLPYLASYTLCNGRMEKDWSLYYDTPHYAVSNGDVKFSRESSKGPLFSLQADDNYIYLLYRDGLLWDIETGKSGRYSDEILVFNHQGEKVACLKLDCNLSEIALDRKRHKLYGQALMPDDALVEFDLPKELLK